MKTPTFLIGALGASILSFSSLAQISDQHGKQDFLEMHDGVSFFHSEDGSIKRIYGNVFSEGQTAKQSADAFLNEWSSLWGFDAEDLLPVGPWGIGNHIQPIMFDQVTQSYKFTGVGYLQSYQGVPIYNSRVTVLCRNESGFPAVHVTSDLYNVSRWNLSTGQPSSKVAVNVLRKRFGSNARISKPVYVIFAGLEGDRKDPALAYVSEVELGNKFIGTFEKYRYIVDANDGSILHIDDLILHTVDGQVKANVTQGAAADECEIELPVPMQYAKVTGGGQTTYADVDGYYELPTSGAGNITVSSGVEGRYFNVNNQGSSDSNISQSTGTDSTLNILHNQENTSEFYRAEVNAYVESNIVRDFTLFYNPDYPVIAGQEEFAVNVNIDSSCNAYYDGSSINFYRNTGGCNNTSFSVIVHHEYGHHLVNTAGSGQGEYGEGFSDVMGVLITGENKLAIGFYQGDCVDGIRNADNDCQYQSSGCSTCGSAIHACGQLISGCVWDIREQMKFLPGGLDALNSICVNSILMHSGTSIDEAIAIDFLTLDDNDSDIGNGTPHYQQIASGFTAHSIDVPQLDFLNYNFPNGISESVLPGQIATIEFEVYAGIEEPNTDEIYLVVEENGDSSLFPATYYGGDSYSVSFPPFDCGDDVRYYFKAESENGTTVYEPLGAPASKYALAVGVINETIALEADFNEGLPSGWSADGLWGATIDCAPGGDCGVGNAMYFGQSVSCDYNQGTVAGALLTPVIDMSDYSGDMVLSFCNALETEDFDSYDRAEVRVNGEMVAELGESNNWETIELPINASSYDTLQVEWYFDSGDDIFNEFRGWHIDNVLLRGASVECDDSGTCEGDVNGDNSVNVSDILMVIDQWGQTDSPADANADGIVNVSDALLIISRWGACP